MAIDITKKPTAGGDEGGEKGGAVPRRGGLDITKKPVGPIAGPVPAVGVSTSGGKTEPAEQKSRWPWLLAAAVALVGLGVFLWPGNKPGNQAGSGEPGAGPASTTDSDSGAEVAAAGSEVAKTVQEPGVPSAIGGQAGAAPGQEPAPAVSEDGKSGEGQGAVPSANGEKGAGGSDRSAAMPAGQNAVPGDGRAGEPPAEQRSVAGVAAEKGKEWPGTRASSSDALATSASSASKQAQEPRGGQGTNKAGIGVTAPGSVPGGAPGKGADPGTPSSAAANPASAVLVVHFDLNSSDVTEDEAARIRSAMESMGAKAPGGILVEGFTCDLGPEEFNLELAQRRSASVARVIREAPGGGNLEIVDRAFGESHPVVPNETGASRKENRRVVVSLK